MDIASVLREYISIFLQLNWFYFLFTITNWKSSNSQNFVIVLIFLDSRWRNTNKYIRSSALFEDGLALWKHVMFATPPPLESTGRYCLCMHGKYIRECTYMRYGLNVVFRSAYKLYYRTHYRKRGTWARFSIHLVGLLFRKSSTNTLKYEIESDIILGNINTVMNEKRVFPRLVDWVFVEIEIE